MKYLLVLPFLLASIKLSTALCTGNEFSKAMVLLQLVGNCYKMFMHSYGLQTTLADYWTFHHLRAQWLHEQGVTVQRRICNIGNTLINCTSPVMSCLDASTLMALGVNESDAVDYVIDRAVTAYQCSVRGERILIKDFYCLGACRTKQAAALSLCDAALPADIAKYGLCPGLNRYLDCYASIYTSCCGSDAGEFICGCNRAGISVTTECVANGELKACTTSNDAAETIAKAGMPLRLLKIDKAQNWDPMRLVSEAARKAYRIHHTMQEIQLDAN